MFRKAKVKLFFSHYFATFTQNHTKHQTKGLEELTAKKQLFFFRRAIELALKKND
jgi:hypothetical protein